jgi:hypothetical protein
LEFANGVLLNLNGVFAFAFFGLQRKNYDHWKERLSSWKSIASSTLPRLSGGTSTTDVELVNQSRSNSRKESTDVIRLSSLRDSRSETPSGTDVPGLD